MQFAFGIGPLMVIDLTGSAALAGLFVGLIGLSRFLVSYPVGRITDAYGRKPGILLGLTLALTGALAIGLSMSFRSMAMLVCAMLVFGMGMNASQQLRVAATDMYLPNRRAQALGYVAMGSLLGLVVSPLVITFAERIAGRLGQDPLGLPWFLLPALIVPGMLLISFVRPDPKEIGMNLARYYPGYTPPPRPAASQSGAFRGWSLMRYAPTRLAIVANTAGQGNMSIVMVLTSLVLHHHGHSLSAIAFSHMFHSAGMFAFTIPLGKLADRFGRGRVMFPGVVAALAGASLVAFTSAFWSVTLGTFLVGLGWAATNVAATALIADYAPTHHRGRAIGVNESFAGGISLAMAVVTGPLIEWFSLPATGFVAVLITLPPLLMLGWIKAGEHAARRRSAAGMRARR
ncbi:MAG: MFS transporter [Burkholderiales bacterium]|nr:MFS transporter [Burkholderiales bacterium]